jgi:hypothetical protein
MKKMQAIMMMIMVIAITITSLHCHVLKKGVT